MLVRQILNDKDTQGVLSLDPEAKVSEAVEIMSSKRIGTMIVSVSGDQPDGILSERDVVRELGKRGPECLDDSVSNMMTANPVTCTPEDSSEKVLQMMTDGRFRHLPVMEGGRMVGLISIGDVVKGRLAQLAMERDALEGMIMGN